MTGASEIGGLAGGIANGLDRLRAFAGRDAGASRAVIDGHGIIGAERGRVRLDHGMQIEPLADFGQDGHAQLSAAEADHEVDDFGSSQFGGRDEVALVFAVLGIDDDYDSPEAECFNGFFNCGKWDAHASGCRSFGRGGLEQEVGGRGADSCRCSSGWRPEIWTGF